MSTETIQQKKKPIKSYEQLLDEYKKLFSKSAFAYIPELAYALRYKEPDLSNSEIRKRLTVDLEGINTKLTIDICLKKTEFVDSVRSERQSKFNLDKAAKKRAEAIQVFNTAQRQLPRTPSLLNEEEEGEEEEPDESIGEPMLESYGDNVESALTLYGNINEPMNKLFYALTKKQLPDSDGIDIILEYLKPSREFRKGIFYEIESDMRTAMYNAMVYTRDALNDTLKLLEDIDKQEGGVKE